MKILPTMSKGVVFVHEDGTIEIAPMQVFRSAGGSTILRLGRNVYYFHEDGTYDGSEHRVGGTGIEMDSPEGQALVAALEEAGENKGLAPEEPHFAPGTAGFEAETRSWPSATHSPGGKTYTTTPKSTKH